MWIVNVVVVILASTALQGVNLFILRWNHSTHMKIICEFNIVRESHESTKWQPRPADKVNNRLTIECQCEEKKKTLPYTIITTTTTTTIIAKKLFEPTVKERREE